MSRIRSIKPEFWTSAQVLECSRDARLLFIGLWNFCDDSGRHVDNSKQIKAELFAADDLLVENVRGMLDELVAHGLLIRYEASGASYLQVTGWHHQRIDKPQRPRYPAPNSALSGERSENGSGTLPPDPIRSDPIRSDGKGEDNPPTPLGGGPGSHTRADRRPRDVRAASQAAWALVTEGSGHAHKRQEIEAADPVLATAVQRSGGWLKFGHSTAIGTLKATFRELYEQLLEQQVAA